LKVVGIDGRARGAPIHRRGSQKTPRRHTCNGVVAYSTKEELLIEGEQMKLEVTKHNEEAARHTSWGKRGLWLKEMVNVRSNLAEKEI